MFESFSTSCLLLCVSECLLCHDILSQILHLTFSSLMYLLICVSVIFPPVFMPLCLSLPCTLSCLAVIEADWYCAALNISAVVMMQKWSQAVFICLSNSENLRAWSFCSWWKNKEAGRVLKRRHPWPETVTGLFLIRYCAFEKAQNRLLFPSHHILYSHASCKLLWRFDHSVLLSSPFMDETWHCMTLIKKIPFSKVLWALTNGFINSN